MKQFFRRNGAFLFLLAIACFTLIYSSANVTRSKLTYESELYKGGVTVDNIGVSLYENGSFVARRDNVKINDGTNSADNAWDRSDNDSDSDADGVLFTNLLGTEKYLKLGHKYKEELTVKNSGAIPQYARILIRKYWADESGKRVDRDPSLIDLELNLDAWKIDEEYEAETAACPEMVVLYYPELLNAGDVTPPATETLTVKGLAAATAHKTTTRNPDGSTTVRTVYDYDGLQFHIEAEVNSVQQHNTSSAMASAWGVSYPVKDPDNSTPSSTPAPVSRPTPIPTPAEEPSSTHKRVEMTHNLNADVYMITWIDEEAENAPGVDYTGKVELAVMEISIDEDGTSHQRMTAPEIISEEEYLDSFYELERAFKELS